jgi:hypothetical protein
MERRLIRDTLFKLAEKMQKDGMIKRGRVSSTSISVELKDDSAINNFTQSVVDEFNRINAPIPPEVIKQFLEVGLNDLEALQQKLYKGHFSPKPVAPPPPPKPPAPAPVQVPPTQTPPEETPPVQTPPVNQTPAA